MTGASLWRKRAQRSGFCPVCGYEGGVTRFGTLLDHNERRIGKNGKPYTTKQRCSGSREQSMEMP